MTSKIFQMFVCFWLFSWRPHKDGLAPGLLTSLMFLSHCLHCLAISAQIATPAGSSSCLPYCATQFRQSPKAPQAHLWSRLRRRPRWGRRAAHSPGGSKPAGVPTDQRDRLSWYGTGRSKTLPGLASHLNRNRRSSELVINIQWEGTKDFKINALN